MIERCWSLDPARLPEQYVHSNWQTESGLPENAITRLLQTSDGYLWIGTQAGLARFDGERIETFDHTNTPALHADYISDLIEDRHGRMWIATDNGGVTVEENGRFTHLDSIGDRSGMAVVACADDSVCVGGYGGVEQVRDGRIVARHTVHTGLSGDPVTRLAFDGHDLWIATLHGLDRLRDGAIRAWSTHDGLPDTDIATLNVGRDGVLWVRTRDQRDARLVGDRFETWSAPGVPDVLAMADDRDGNRWLGTSADGLVRWSNGRIDKLPANAGLAGDQVSVISEDHQGNLWVGTLGSGLHRFRDGSFTSWWAEQGLVWSVLEDRDGCIWAAIDAGIVRRCNGQIRRFGVADGLPGGRFRSLWEDHDGGLWAGSATAGAWRVFGDKVVAHLDMHDGLPANGIGTIFEDRLGQLWISVPGHGLARYAKGRMQVFDAARGLPDDFVIALAEDADGGIWVGSNSGLARIRGEQVESMAAKPGYPKVVLSLREDAGNALWIGTATEGLLRLQEGRLTHYTTREGLPGDRVNSILVDASGDVWIGSDKGIYRIGRQELDAIAQGKGGRLAVVVFGRGDGMASDDTVAGSQSNAWRTRRGALWFATSKGAATVDPKRLALDTVPLAARVESLRVDDAPIDLRAPVRLKPGTRRLQIRYGATDLSEPERIGFLYRLEGFDTAWVTGSPQRTADYTNLPPGHYVFHVRASSETGAWGRQEASLAFELEPAFYQTGWFRLLCLLVSIGILWAAYRMRVSWLKSRNAVLEERQRIAGEIHDNLAQSLSGILFQSEAALMAIERAPEAIRPHLESTRDLARSSLEQASYSVWQLGSPGADERSLSESISKVVQQIAGGRVERLDFDSNGLAWTLPPEAENHVVRIAQEAASNAIRHGRARCIKVCLAWLPDAMRLEVSDDGIGMPVELGAPAAGHGFGLRSMQRRADRLGARLDIRSAADGGTTLSLAIPRYRAIGGIWRRLWARTTGRNDA